MLEKIKKQIHEMVLVLISSMWSWQEFGPASQLQEREDLKREIYACQNSSQMIIVDRR